ncbi:MAG: 2-phosphosulfolactate phosphatase [Candidatus Altiarchaeota archaeon]
MNINITALEEGARRAKGVAVVIDVLRFSSTVTTILSKKPKEFICVASPKKALAIKDGRKDCVIFGEQGSKLPKGFDFDNSPLAALDAKLSDKTVVICTSNGARIIEAITKAELVFIGSFLNAQLLANEIVKIKPREVYLIGAGRHGEEAREDTLCAEYLRDLLEWGEPDFKSIKSEMLLSQRYIDYEERGLADEFEYCLKLNSVEFIPMAQKIRDMYYIKDRLEGHIA